MGNATFTPFNLATMSGVFPGTRTQVFQRVRLQQIGNEGTVRWAQILWYESPPACVVIVRGAQSGEGELLFRLEGRTIADVHRQLTGEMVAHGWQLRACGTCQQWRQTATREGDQLPLGECMARLGWDKSAIPELLSMQSHLALDCPHWQAGQINATTESALSSIPPLTKVAEISESKLKPMQRLQRQIKRWLRDESGAASADLREQLLERSGVGAGTEPCFACQGRIANLGALTVESTTGDKQTFSVWRCRSCYSLYLSDWTDRWERLENLETEEIIYRLAPSEALQLLETIQSIPGGEHPAQRSERVHVREWMLNYVAERPKLSHQLKQGR